MVLLFSDEVARLPPVWVRAVHSVYRVCLSLSFCQLMYTSFPFSFAGGIWDLISVDLH